MTTVVAAVIRREEQILICRRGATQPHPLKWEFPGGKVEANEDPPQALRRELREELALQDVQIQDEIERYEFRYPGKNPILLIFYLVTGLKGEPRNCIFEEIRWVAPATLPDFDFLEGDVEFVKRLSGRDGKR